MRYQPLLWTGLLLISLGSLSIPSVWADTLILKDGRSIRCDIVREEGEKVIYWIGETKLTIAKDKVDHIERNGEKGDILGTSTPSTNSSASASQRLSALPNPLLPNLTSELVLSSEDLSKLEASVKAQPSNKVQAEQLVKALNAMATKEYQAGHYNQAKDLLQRALKTKKEDVNSLVFLGTIALAEGRYLEAADYSRHALEVDGNSPGAYYQLGAAYYATEQLPEAIKAWQATLKLTKSPVVQAALEKAEREMRVAGNFTGAHSRFFNLSLEGKAIDLSLENTLVGLLEDSYSLLKRRFDYEPKEKISAIFYTEQTFFDVTRAPSWAGALNDGKLRVPIGGISGNTSELARNITHELTHSFVKFKSQGRCPTWLNEGLAQVMEGKVSSEYQVPLTKLAASGHLPPLQLLSGSFVGLSDGQALVAYAYSLAATEILTERGLNVAVQILEDLSQNNSIDTALARHTRFHTLADFELEIKRRLSE